MVLAAYLITTLLVLPNWGGAATASWSSLRGNRGNVLTPSTWQKYRINTSRPPGRHLHEASPTFAPYNYTLLSAAEIVDTLQTWQSRYPDFIQVTTSQDAFGLATAGNVSDCAFDDAVEGCRNHFATIQHYGRHPTGSPSSNALPEMLATGTLHGDERVGPTAVLEAAGLMLLAADCYEQMFTPANSSNDDTSVLLDCQQQLRDVYDITMSDIRWLHRLVSTRRLVLLPLGNTLGYDRNERNEGSFDPNRDFPYDRADTSCFSTASARTIHQLFLRHLFQQTLTFHAGTTVIAYQYGSPFWGTAPSPDDVVQNQLAGSLSAVAGSELQYSAAPYYVFGRIAVLIYTVLGGFDNWAYAASWDRDRLWQCDTDYGQLYDTHDVDDMTYRAIPVVVETSTSKNPQSDLGSSLQILQSAEGAGNGHVPRDARILLRALDLLEPYVEIVSINNISVAQDLGTGCAFVNDTDTAAAADVIDVVWSIGGVMTPNATTLWLAKVDDVDDCSSIPRNVSSLYRQVQNNTPVTLLGQTAHLGFDFAATVPLPAAPALNFVMVACAVVDVEWAIPVTGARPLGATAQSHMAQVRTNASWYHSKNGLVIQGRDLWCSRPVHFLNGSERAALTVSPSQSLSSPAPSPRVSQSVPSSSATDTSAATTVGVWGSTKITSNSTQAVTHFGYMISYVGIAIFWMR